MIELLTFFSRPLFLLALPAGLLVLVYVYRRRGPGQKLLVSSTILLKLIASPVRARSKFKPPLRFFLELLLVSLLVLAAANFFLHSDSLRVAVVIDNSFSSYARLKDKTRLDLIKEQAQTIASGLPRNAKVQVFTAAPVLTAIGDLSQFNLNLQSVLAEVSPAYAGTNLNSALQTLAQHSAVDEVYVISALNSNANSQASQIKFRSIASELGTINNNIAISSIDFKSQETGAGKLLATIRSFAELPVDFEMTGRCLNTEGKWINLQATEQQVKPGAVLKSDLVLPQSNLRGCRVELKVGAEQSSRDLLREDNTAWVTTLKDQRAIIYVGKLSNSDTGLDRLSDYNLIRVSPDSYNSQQNSGARVTIFHRTNPDLLPASNWLMIMPGKSDSFYPALEQKTEQITLWSRTHPLLRYLQPNLLQSGTMQTFAEYPGFDALVTAASGPVFLAGQLDSGRAIVSGLELLPFSGKENSTLSILLLNSLKWLSEYDASHKRIFTVYAPVSTTASFNYLDVGGGRFSKRFDGSVRHFPEPGLIEYRDNDNEALLAINYFDEQQSNLNSSAPVEFNLPEFATKSVEQDNLKSWLLLIAIAILLIDLIRQILSGVRRARLTGGQTL